MRFRFCGDLDCPDWVLAEISTLAKIVLRDLLGEAMEYEKILKLTSDARLVGGCEGHHRCPWLHPLQRRQAQCGWRVPVKRAAAAGAAQRACRRVVPVLRGEAELPPGQAEGLQPATEMQEVNEPLVHLSFHLRDGERGGTAAVPVALSANKFRVLLAELKQAQAMMNTLL
ncbi:COMM domain-containing protein 4 isoform X3 [Chroicocephalus ridibundus]|uniref:COMM domain-containing protein 4 isoform X3 n=1 Tax=Chroicocephalus ridibundus TaxID=1192867 RepID=UPI002FDECF62